MGKAAIRAKEGFEVPEGWELVRLHDVTVESTARNRDLNLGRADVLGVDNRLGLILSDRVLGEDFSRYKLVHRGQFAYNPMRLNVGSIGLCRSDVARLVSPDYIVFESRLGRLDPGYLDFFRRSGGWDEQIQRSGQGSVRIRYYYRHISEFMVPLPPLAEQRAIAHVLRTVEVAKEASESTIAAARQLKASLMRHLFTYGPVPVEEADRVALQDSEFGPFPSHWQKRRLGELIASGPQNGLYKPESFYGSGTPIIRINDYPNEGGVVQGAPRRVRLTDAEVQTYLLAKGDLLINRVNSLSHIGKAALVGKPAEPTVFESNMMRFRVITEVVTPEYAFVCLCTPNCRDALRGLAKRAVAQSSVNQGDVKSLVLPVPPLEEQAQITSMLAGVEEKIRTETHKVNALHALFSTLLHHLMTGKVRVGPLAPVQAEEAIS